MVKTRRSSSRRSQKNRHYKTGQPLNEPRTLSVETADQRELRRFRQEIEHVSRPEIRGELNPTTLALAIHRQPPAPGMLHHSDSGVQFAAPDFARLPSACGITQSMSRTGNPYPASVRLSATI